MNRPGTLRVAAVYGCLSAVYLLYLPHATPVLDDWTILQIFHEARASGPARALLFFRELIENTWWGQARFFWVSFVPVYLLSFLADFSGWPYFLLAWTAHLVTAVLLYRSVSLLAGDVWTAFASGAIYVVLPAASGSLFWPLGNYYGQGLALGAYLYFWARRIGPSEYRGYSWKDFVLLVVVVFTGEQILPAILLLPAVTHFLWGRREDTGRFVRRGLIDCAAAVAAVMLYLLIINRVPLRWTAGLRFGGWRLPGVGGFLGSLLAVMGLKPSFVGWRPEWRPGWTLLLLLAAALGVLLWSVRRFRPKQVPQSVGLKLFVWSVAGLVLVYLPVAALRAFEIRHLYVMCGFLAPAGVAILSLLPARPRVALVTIAVAYCISLVYFEMRQCWIPQSRAARALLAAVAESGPMHSGDILVFSGGQGRIGFALNFITGTSWSMKSALAHATGGREVRGGTDVLVDFQGNLALDRAGERQPLARGDLEVARVFVLESGKRYVAKRYLALLGPNGRYAPLSLRPSKTALHEPPRMLTWEELRMLPDFRDVYVAPHTASLHGP